MMGMKRWTGDCDCLGDKATCRYGGIDDIKSWVMSGIVSPHDYNTSQRSLRIIQPIMDVIFDEFIRPWPRSTTNPY